MPWAGMTAPIVSEKMRSIGCHHSLIGLGLELESGPPGYVICLRNSSSKGPTNIPAPDFKLQLWVFQYLGPKHHGSLCQYRKIIVTQLTRRHPRAGTRTVFITNVINYQFLSGYLPTKHRSIKCAHIQTLISPIRLCVSLV
jgi:hypothetical protein